MSPPTPASLLEESRARWAHVDEPTRAKAEAAILAAVTAKLAEDPWYESSSRPARVEVLGATGPDDQLRVYFVADHLNYCYAQSGSDWAEHRVFAGELADLAEASAAVRVELVDQTRITEREWDEGYDRAPFFEGLREEQRARLEAGLPLGRPTRK